MPALETRRYVISGRVQGVGFRWFVEREAAQLGLTGWVRNCNNGDVEVMATGKGEQLNSLRQKLEQGSPGFTRRPCRRIQGPAVGRAIIPHRRSLVSDAAETGHHL